MTRPPRRTRHRENTPIIGTSRPDPLIPTIQHLASGPDLHLEIHPLFAPQIGTALRKLTRLGGSPELREALDTAGTQLEGFVPPGADPRAAPPVPLTLLREAGPLVVAAFQRVYYAQPTPQLMELAWKEGHRVQELVCQHRQDDDELRAQINSGWPPQPHTPRP